MTNQKNLKLSQRLDLIDRMIPNGVDHIWDCCCDHGLLGMQLLQRRAAPMIHFVDVVESLMIELRQTLQRHADSDGWQVHCRDVADLPLSGYGRSESHMIVIAGVGGELVADLVQSIVARYPKHHLEFVLCPVHHAYQLRETLAELQLGLRQEQLVRDNGRHYEVIHVSSESKEPISLVGEALWDFSFATHRDYLKKTIEHYQKVARSDDPVVAAKANRTAAAYQALVN